MGVGASIRSELGLGDEPDFLTKKNHARTKATSKHGDPHAVQVVMEVHEDALPKKLWRQEGTSLTQLQEGIFRHLSGTAYRTYKVTRAMHFCSIGLFVTDIRICLFGRVVICMPYMACRGVVRRVTYSESVTRSVRSSGLFR